MSRLTELDHRDFTDAQRHALIAAIVDLRHRERELRMNQADAFCNGRDDLATSYDRWISEASRDLRELKALQHIACRWQVSS